VSLGVRLVTDSRAVFAGRDAVHTEVLLEALHRLPDSPWADLSGEPLNARGLARPLRPYDVRSDQVKVDGVNRY
jgi:hypothetical protein